MGRRSRGPRRTLPSRYRLAVQVGKRTGMSSGPDSGGSVMTGNNDLLRRITARPDVFGGKPIIRDLRISVEFILSLLAQGVSVEELLDDHPGLETDDIRACAAYAHAVIARDTLERVSVTPA